MMRFTLALLLCSIIGIQINAKHVKSVLKPQKTGSKTDARQTLPIFGDCTDETPEDEKLDIRGNRKCATQREDDIALKIFNKWLAKVGGNDGMNCQRLRLTVTVFAKAPLDWVELTGDAVKLAKDEKLWSKACDRIYDVKECRKVLGETENMIEDLNNIDKFISILKEKQEKFREGLSTKSCKEVLFSFIHQLYFFKTHLQEAITCVPEMPQCNVIVDKHRAIYSKYMYQTMRKGRAKSEEAKIAAVAMYGDQNERPHETRNGGISQEPANTIENLRNFFTEVMVHGKTYMQRDVSDIDENPAKVFKLSNAPFIGGLSGSILEVYRLLDAYAGKDIIMNGANGKEEKVMLHKADDDLALLFMALLDLGGHHSLTETAISTHEWGLLQGLDMPFTADTDLTQSGVDKSKLPSDYNKFLKSLTERIEGAFM